MALASTYVSGVTVTPTGVREGDPAALAALCAVRGPSVVAYCRHVAGETDAGAAAADAFARFRVAVTDAGDATSVDPEALLISATRCSAAGYASAAAQGDCAEVPALLAARAEKTIAPPDLERLGSHLEQCSACRAPVARFRAAERAYRDPPEKSVDPALTAQIVGALIAAVPPAPPEAAPPASNGNGARVAEAERARTPDVPLEQPTEHFDAPGIVEPEPADGEERAAEAEAEAGDRAEVADAWRRRRRWRWRAKAPAGAEALVGGLHPSMPRRRRLVFVLPIVVILLALLAALYVSGVFGGNDPESSPVVAVPTAEPVDPTKPELVVVPGAEDASADAVEKAKARARGEDDSGSAQSDSIRSTPAASPPPAAASPSAAPAAPAVSPNHPVTKPAPKPATKPAPTPDEEKQIDAGGGATGAEQIPPPADASDVPDLAPPSESGTTP